MIEANDEMFFPFKDDNPPHRPSYFTYGLIALNVLVFLYQFSLPPADIQRFVTTYGFQPGAFFGDADKAFSATLALFTSMFMHGGFMHLAGNMLYLWIFADNVECALGRGRFMVFYLICGLGAALTHGALEPNSMIPMVGASGAISGVLGAYLLLYPKANIQAMLALGLFFTRVNVPAWVVLGLWFVMQFIGAAGAPAGEAGVAFWAHIGGFIAGLALVRPLLPKREHLFHSQRSQPWQIESKPIRKGRGPLGRGNKGPWE